MEKFLPRGHGLQAVEETRIVWNFSGQLKNNTMMYPHGTHIPAIVSALQCSDLEKSGAAYKVEED
jgi:hypothetical protein